MKSPENFNPQSQTPKTGEQLEFNFAKQGTEVINKLLANLGEKPSSVERDQEALEGFPDMDTVRDEVREFLKNYYNMESFMSGDAMEVLYFPDSAEEQAKELSTLHEVRLVYGEGSVQEWGGKGKSKRIVVDLEKAAQHVFYKKLSDLLSA